MPLIYSFLDLPQLPASIIDAANTALVSRQRESRVNPKLLEQQGFTEYANRTVITDSGKQLKNAGSYRYWISEEFEEWVRIHFKQDPAGCGINIFEASADSVVAPHVDPNRNFSIHYLLEPGGIHATTMWWQEKNKLLDRADLKNNFNLADTITNYSKLQEVAKICIPKHRWICMNTNILHSVENITSPRISIQISRNTFPDHIKLLESKYVE
jgi:hypothetical protein